MAVIANLPRALGKAVRKLSATQAAITGTGAVTTGLTPTAVGPGGIDTGGAVACGANSATTIPTNLVTISSISGGNVVNIVVVAAAAAANTISAVAENVNVLATGF